MKLCFYTNYNEKTVEFAHEVGLRSMELSAWPDSSLNADRVTDQRISEIKRDLEEHDIEISALGYYPNFLDPDRAKTIIQNRTETQLRTLVNALAEKYQKELNTSINKILYRKMKTKWASNSRNNNITVNKLLKYLPDEIIEYIIYHEVAHSIEKKHNDRFWRIIQKRFKNYQSIEGSLLIYWFLVHKLNMPNHAKNE